MTIKNKITKTLASQALKLQKNSPHIFFVGGVVGVVAGTVMACRATLKTNDMFDEMREDVEAVKRDIGDQKDVAYAYAHNVVRFTKAYGPAILVTGASIGLLTKSHVQLTRRNTALTVAYAGLHQAYSEYRDRVREHVGEEREKELYFGSVTEKVKGEDGKLTEIKTVDPNKLSPYARFFDEYSPNWQKNSEYNNLFVKCQQNYANNLLQARGHLFLNEVYDMLGIDRSSAGAIVGWVISKDGDNYVDFGVFDAHNSHFVNGYERSILLDFNIDGVIYDKI